MTSPLSPETRQITLLCLDSSTDVTGAVILAFDGKGCPTVLHMGAFDAKAAWKDYAKFRKVKPCTVPSIRQRIDRIAMTRDWFIHRFLQDSRGDWSAIDGVAFETTAVRGNPAALNQCLGALLTISYFNNVDLIPVNPTQTKAPIKAGFRPKGQTAETLNEKGRMVQWANQAFGLSLVSGKSAEGRQGEAQADALGVGMAAYTILQKAEAAK